MDPVPRYAPLLYLGRCLTLESPREAEKKCPSSTAEQGPPHLGVCWLLNATPEALPIRCVGYRAERLDRTKLYLPSCIGGKSAILSQLVEVILAFKMECNSAIRANSEQFEYSDRIVKHAIRPKPAGIHPQSSTSTR